MQSNFQIVAAPLEDFAHLFSLSDADLAARGARRMTVDANPGYPCRVSLQDAEKGEQVILTPFKHHAVDSPYQASGPVFVREAAQTAKLQVNEIPLMVHHRLLSIRAYDRSAMMVGAKVVAGQELAENLRRFFDNEKVAYLHLHNAGPGCFNCLVQRA